MAIGRWRGWLVGDYHYPHEVRSGDVIVVTEDPAVVGYFHVEIGGLDNGLAEQSAAGIGGQVAEESFDGFSKGCDVVVDGGLDDGMGGVDVAVRQVVAHPGYLAPLDGWFGVEKRHRYRLDGFSDLQQPEADGVEDEPV